MKKKNILGLLIGEDRQSQVDLLQALFLSDLDDGESVCKAIIEARCFLIEDKTLKIREKELEAETLVVKMAVDFLITEHGYEI